MTTISPTAFGGTAVRPARRSRTTSSPSSSAIWTGLDLAPQPVESPVVEPADANTAELLLASADLVGRRANGDRSPWLATAVILAGVLAALLLTLAGAAVLAPLLLGF